MKQVLAILFLLVFSQQVLAQNETGPEGSTLALLAFLVLLAVIMVILFSKPRKTSGRFKRPLFRRKRINVELKKDRLYYPDELELIITNTGNTDVDIDTPLLIFSGFWLNRKFKLKGTNNTRLYPLYLIRGQSHTLIIDLNRFYLFDRTLKRLPRATVVVKEVKGKRMGSQRVLLRKTLFNL